MEYLGPVASPSAETILLFSPEKDVMVRLAVQPNAGQWKATIVYLISIQVPLYALNVEMVSLKAGKNATVV